jgi:hypothetical protein
MRAARRYLPENKLYKFPAWFGREDVHLAHRSFLRRFAPKEYTQRFPNVNPNLLCLWPLAGVGQPRALQLFS